MKDPEALLSKYERDGVIRIPALFSPEEVNAVRKGWIARFANVNPIPSI